jgi:hypothetical protein
MLRAMPGYSELSMIALLLLLWIEGRTYHGVSVAELKETQWTHVAVCGQVTLAKREDDGDIHLRISQGAAFIVAEIVPYHPLPMPKLHSWVRVAGISREDKTHRWFEVHDY